MVFKEGFWYDVTQSWFQLAFTEPKNKAQIRLQPIWLNSNIKNENTLFYNQRTVEFGFIYISQLVKPDGSFASNARIRTSSDNTVSFLQYYAIIQAITMEKNFKK